MNHEIVFTTDAATLAVFDPATLADRIEDEEDWWAMDFHQLPEVAAGKIALVGLGGDGTFRLRISDTDLAPAERAYAREKLKLGVEVISGGLLVGAGELLPGGGYTVSFDDYPGFVVPAPNGSYQLEVYSIDWREAADLKPAGEPADVVLLLRPRRGRFAAPKEDPRIFCRFGVWVFPDEPRQTGPSPGLIVSTVVIARGKERLLKPEGRWLYRPILADMSGLAWKDQVEVRVVAVDHQEKSFQAELVRKLPREE
jgi:hypothetical protein